MYKNQLFKNINVKQYVIKVVQRKNRAGHNYEIQKYSQKSIYILSNK